MDAFETLVARLLEHDGYWVRRSFKVKLTTKEKHAIDRPSSPRWEIDLLAYHAKSNEIRVVECKSYLDSPGVNFQSLTGLNDKKKYYKLFNETRLRQVVFRRLVHQLLAEGACRPKLIGPPKIGPD